MYQGEGIYLRIIYGQIEEDNREIPNFPSFSADSGKCSAEPQVMEVSMIQMSWQFEENFRGKNLRFWVSLSFFFFFAGILRYSPHI